MKIEITEVQIVPVKAKEGLVAFASIVFNDGFFLGSIGVHSKLDGTGFRLTYPTKKVGNRNINIYHPINKVVSQAIEDAVFGKLKDVMTYLDDRYSSFKST
jgi:DNA-binding cell septation regulator SpoVG